ncbi:MAG TPA: pyruvate dehydrogenase (acetyl-transferring) E1 component subunit alpha [Gammaproteobacteria bacterium]
MDTLPARQAGQDRTAASERVAQFEVRYTQFLDKEGRALRELPPLARDPELLVSLYEHMVLNRLFDRKAVALQRTGQLGTYPSALGQEATAVAVGAAMAREDVLLGTYRETAAMLIRGVEMREILLYWGGDETGMAYAGPRAPKEDFPISVPIATHAPQAVGVAYAFKLRKEPRVAVCVVGDGATSKGDFYEALNGAAVWRLPLVFVIVNNGWAISMPRSAQSATATLAQKAIAAGIEGEQVDGNDVIAVYDAMRCALEKARAGGGPHVIEALTYRLADHTTADDARRYRSAEEVERQAELDPVKRLRAHLVRQGLWGAAQEEALQAECGARVEQAVREYLAAPAREPASMFDHLFAELPEALRAQREELRGAAMREPSDD